MEHKLANLYCGRIVRYYNRGKSGERGRGYGWIEKRLDPSTFLELKRSEVWFHISIFKKHFPNLATALDSNPNALSDMLFWFFIGVQDGESGRREYVEEIYTDRREIPFQDDEIVLEIKKRFESIVQETETTTPTPEAVIAAIQKLEQTQNPDKIAELLMELKRIHDQTHFHFTDEQKRIIDTKIKRIRQIKHPTYQEIVKKASQMLEHERFKTTFADEILLLAPDLLLSSNDLRERVLSYASLDGVLRFVDFVSQSGMPSVVEDLVRQQIQLGRLRDIWSKWRLSHEFLVQPFVERLSQTEASEERQWLIERLIQADSVVVLCNQQLRQIALQYADHKVLLDGVCQVVEAAQNQDDVRTLLTEIAGHLPSCSEPRRTALADGVLALASELILSSYILREGILSYASLDGVLRFVDFVSQSGMPSVVEDLVRQQIQLGRLRDIWSKWRLSHEFLVQPFVERLSQTEASEERQWLIDRLLEIDSWMVLHEPGLRQLAFQIADCRILLNSINQLVASDDQNSIIIPILEDVERYLLDHFAQDLESAWELIPNVEQFVEYRGFLWGVAPDRVKLEILKKRYPKFFCLLEMCENLRHNKGIIFQDLCSIVEQFTECDTRWVLQFIADKREHENEHEQATTYTARAVILGEVDDKDFLYRNRKYYVARVAEKAAITYYRELGFEVEDLSIVPVCPGNASDDRWKFADLELQRDNNKHYIDVKSAILMDGMYYSDLFIKKFKSHNERSVSYLGIVSKVNRHCVRGGQKYQRFTPCQRCDSACVVKAKTIVLGEINKNIIDKIKSYCDSNGLIFEICKDLIEGNHLPIYFFDHNRIFYIDIIDLIKEIKKLEESEIPDWDDTTIALSFYRTNPIGMFLMARRRLPEDWNRHLDTWAREFVNLIQCIPAKGMIRLPFVFFAILIHFLRVVSRQVSDEKYDPEEYLKLLSVGEYTLGICDPLDILTNFVENIVKPLWQSRSQIEKFRIFKLKGPQWLQATRSTTSEDAEWVTLVAWCEGCGYFPLVYGRNPTCTSCGRLICMRYRYKNFNDDICNCESCCYACSQNCKLNRLCLQCRRKRGNRAPIKR
jgi:hypothetical protein